MAGSHSPKKESPWILFAHRIAENLSHAWLKNYKPHAINTAPLKYLDIDLKKQAEGNTILIVTELKEKMSENIGLDDSDW